MSSRREWQVVLISRTSRQKWEITPRAVVLKRPISQQNEAAFFSEGEDVAKPFWLFLLSGS